MIKVILLTVPSCPTVCPAPVFPTHDITITALVYYQALWRRQHHHPINTRVPRNSQPIRAQCRVTCSESARVTWQMLSWAGSHRSRAPRGIPPPVEGRSCRRAEQLRVTASRRRKYLGHTIRIKKKAKRLWSGSLQLAAGWSRWTKDLRTVRERNWSLRALLPSMSPLHSDCQ